MRDYAINNKEWKKLVSQGTYTGPLGRNNKAFKAFDRLNYQWNQRTNGRGNLFLTALYCLKAHSRGKVHCHKDFAAQANFLVQALPFLQCCIVKFDRLPNRNLAALVVAQKALTVVPQVKNVDIREALQAAVSMQA